MEDEALELEGSPDTLMQDMSQKGTTWLGAQGLGLNDSEWGCLQHHR